MRPLFGGPVVTNNLDGGTVESSKASDDDYTPRLEPWRAGMGNEQYSRFVACFSSMHIVDRFPNDFES
jgi:hypothetical protein